MDYLNKVFEKGLNFLNVYFDFVEFLEMECYQILFNKEVFDVEK